MRGPNPSEQRQTSIDRLEGGPDASLDLGLTPDQKFKHLVGFDNCPSVVGHQPDQRSSCERIQVSGTDSPYRCCLSAPSVTSVFLCLQHPLTDLYSLTIS